MNVLKSIIDALKSPKRVDIPPPLNSPSWWESLQDGEHIDVEASVFQRQGRNLFEAQVLCADAESLLPSHSSASASAPSIDPNRVVEVCKRYCELISAVNYLRADYARIRAALDFKSSSDRDTIEHTVQTAKAEAAEKQGVDYGNGRQGNA